jgi:hypothetical protein
MDLVTRRSIKFWGKNAIETGGAVALFKSRMRAADDSDGFRDEQRIYEHAAMRLRVSDEEDI